MSGIQIPTKLTGFTPILDTMSSRYGLVGAAVFGVVWRHANMRNGVCSASQERMAELLGVNRMTVNKWIATFCDNGYLEDTTPDTKNRAHVYRVTGKAGLMQTIEAFDFGDNLNSSDDFGDSLNSTTDSLNSSSDSLNSSSDNLVSTSRLLRDNLEEEVVDGAAATPNASLPEELATQFIEWANINGKKTEPLIAEAAVKQWLLHVQGKGKGWRVKNFKAIGERYDMIMLEYDQRNSAPNMPYIGDTGKPKKYEFRTDPITGENLAYEVETEAQAEEAF